MKCSENSREVNNVPKILRPNDRQFKEAVATEWKMIVHRS